MGNLPDIPKLGFGLGLRGVHVPHILSAKPAVDWFEVISENYLDNGGAAFDALQAIKQHYPIVMHGVSLSIGTVDPVNSDYLRKLAALADTLKPAWISDHLCWTGVAHQNTHDLLPVPYTQESLAHIIDRIKAVQDALGRRIVLENPSTYLEFKASTIAEEDFIARMADGADCGLLLDVNNVYVSCYNHRKNPKAYIDALPLERVAQMHLAGHTNKGTHIVDTHDGPVIDDVWALYKYVIAKAGPQNTMIEWDDDIPAFDVVNAELMKARAAAADAQNMGALPDFTAVMPAYTANAPQLLGDAQTRMHGAIITGNDNDPDAWIRDKPAFSAQDQLNVYIHGYRLRLFDVVSGDYPILRKYMGDAACDALIRDYINATTSSFYDAGKYPTLLPAFIKGDVFASELAALENAISQLATGPETPALSPMHLAHVTPEGLMDMHLPLRAACTLFAFTHDVNAYYGGDDTVRKTPTYLAVFRHEGAMWRLPLDGDEYAFLKRLQGGASVGEAFDDNTPEDALADWFSRWMRNNLLAVETASPSPSTKAAA